MNTWQRLKNNPSLWERYFVRERVLKAVRAFFDEKRFHEVETPLLIPHPAAESYLDVFRTTLLDRNRTATPAYLSTSPELSLKKLIVAGIGDCYSITKSFRNTETDSATHSPEFSLLEWYRVGKRYEAIMDDCEVLIRHVQATVNNTTNLVYQGKAYDVKKKWERISVKTAFQTYAGVNLEEFFDLGQAKKIAKKKGYAVYPDTTWELLFNQIFLNEVEPHLGGTGPTILYAFPSPMAALAKKDDADPRYAKRFEVYIGGLELGDCYEELTDWNEQKKRFDAELRKVKHLGKTLYEYDREFIDALKAGMPATSGIAVGLDRLIMLIGNMTDIAETSFFPTQELFEKK